MLCVA
ncbi:outer membrane lipoblc domain protein, partial [Vibrio paracholerae 87395]